jgi:HAD superfamily hydrolase (TIGR01509 family)
MKVKGVAFDLEGTLINVEEAHHKGHLKAAEEVGVSLTFDEAVERVPCFIGGPDTRIVEGIWELSDKQKPVSFIAQRDKYHYQKFLKELTIKLRPGSEKIIKWLKKNNYQISIGSLTPADQAMYLIERAGLLEYISKDCIVMKEDVPELKPAPYVYLETAKRMGIDCSEQIVFEDSPQGVSAAAKAGALVVIGMPAYNDERIITLLKEEGVGEIFYDWHSVNIEEIIKLVENKQ